MSGIFNGISDSFTGNGGQPGSQLPKGAIPQLTSSMLDNLRMAQMLTQQTQTRAGDQFSTQQNLLPFIYQQLGIGSDRLGGDAGYELGNFRYEGTDAQRGMDEMARLGMGSLPTQYGNIGYSLDANGNPVEDVNSQRNQFVDAQGRSVADAERLRQQAMYNLFDPNGAGQRATQGLGNEFQKAQLTRDQALQLLMDPNGAGTQAMRGAQQSLTGSQGIRDEAYQNFIAGQGTGENLYNSALGSLYGAQGVQGEAMDATRRQLQTAEGLQAPSLDRLGIGRDAAGNYYNDPNSRMGQYDTAMYQQMGIGQDLQRETLAQMGYTINPQGNIVFDPNSTAGHTSQSYQDLIQQSQGEVGTSQQLRDAELGRLGMTRDASGNWVNDPGSNEMRARGLMGDFLTRAKAGMEGNAPINPGLQRQLAQEEQQLREGLIRQLGAGYATSSPGMEALSNFSKRRSELMYTEQQDAMNMGVNQALNLQGSNLSSLASLYGVSEPVLRALANSTNVSNSASNAANQTNATNANVMGQLQQNVLNPINTASNVNAQTLASLYGLTQPALAAAGQMGTMGNNNLATNMGAYGQLNTINQANQGSNRAGYANLSGMDMNSANIAQLLNSMNLGNVNAYGQVSNMGTNAANIGNMYNNANLNNLSAYGNVANIGQDAINNRAQGALNFSNSNAAILGTIPQQQQQLYNTANNGRLSSIAALYPATSSGFDQSTFQNLAQIYGQLGSTAGNQAQGFGGQIMQGDVGHYNTNINNMFWQNFMSSMGKSAGSYVGGGGGMGGMGG